MTIQFRNLFTLEVAHGYYRAGCQDFEFLLPADTVRQFQNGKLLARVRAGKLYVLFEANEAHAPLASIAGAKLRIGLKLRNPCFSNFTRLDFDVGTAKVLYCNRAVPGALDAPVAVALVGPVFGHTLSKPDRPVTVTVKEASGHALAAQTITADNDRRRVAFDLTGQPPASYAIEERYPAETTTTGIYLDPELRQAGVFGVVEIRVLNGFYTNAPAFQVPFAAREETLKYYVVARNYSEAEFTQLSVTDAGFTEDVRPQVAFTKVAAAEFTASELPSALLKPGPDRLVLFKSQTAVARQETARKKIQLNKNGEVLIAHLPQPGVAQARADLIVHIAKPKP